MAKRSSYDIQTKILGVVKEEECSYAGLERKLSTGYRTIKLNCDQLESYGQIKIKKIEKNPSNGKPSYLISITKEGIETLSKKKIKK
jgi:hypothetical protein